MDGCAAHGPRPRWRAAAASGSRPRPGCVLYGIMQIAPRKQVADACMFGKHCALLLQRLRDHVCSSLCCSGTLTMYVPGMGVRAGDARRWRPGAHGRRRCCSGASSLPRLACCCAIESTNAGPAVFGGPHRFCPRPRCTMVQRVVLIHHREFVGRPRPQNTTMCYG